LKTHTKTVEVIGEIETEIVIEIEEEIEGHHLLGSVTDVERQDIGKDEDLYEVLIDIDILYID
jgi:hypothetical protein